MYASFSIRHFTFTYKRHVWEFAPRGRRKASFFIKFCPETINQIYHVPWKFASKLIHGGLVQSHHILWAETDRTDFGQNSPAVNPAAWLHDKQTNKVTRNLDGHVLHWPIDFTMHKIYHKWCRFACKRQCRQGWACTCVWGGMFFHWMQYAYVHIDQHWSDQHWSDQYWSTLIGSVLISIDRISIDQHLSDQYTYILTNIDRISIDQISIYQH